MSDRVVVSWCAFWPTVTVGTSEIQKVGNIFLQVSVARNNALCFLVTHTHTRWQISLSCYSWSWWSDGEIPLRTSTWVSEFCAVTDKISTDDVPNNYRVSHHVDGAVWWTVERVLETRELLLLLEILNFILIFSPFTSIYHCVACREMWVISRNAQPAEAVERKYILWWKL